MKTRLASLISLFVAPLTAQCADLVFESGPQRTHLIELFTSQGCSSCPPAEAWLSKLKSEPGLWKDFVPIAFHVDYWDRLGWRDPFASREWTARQYEYSENWKAESVYTPGFVLDGREWMERSVPAAATEKPGVLSLSVKNQKLSAQFMCEFNQSKPTASNPAGLKSPKMRLYVAALGFDLTTKIGAGENSGRNLKQDFVVLSLANIPMSAISSIEWTDKVGETKITIHTETDLPFNPDPRAKAVAAWITAPNQLEPVQVVGGWLNR